MTALRSTPQKSTTDGGPESILDRTKRVARKVGRLALLPLMIASVVAANPIPAHATSCLARPWPIEDHVAAAEWVFTGHRVFRWFWQSRSDDPNLEPIRVKVVGAFKGEIPSVVEVWMDRRDAEHWGSELVSFAATPDAEGGVHLGDCYGAIANADADELAEFFSETPISGRVVPHPWRSPWAPIVVVVALGAGMQRHRNEDLNDALGLD